MRPVAIYFFLFLFFDCVFIRGYQLNAYRVQEVMYMSEAFWCEAVGSGEDWCHQGAAALAPGAAAGC